MFEGAFPINDSGFFFLLLVQLAAHVLLPKPLLHTLKNRTWKRGHKVSVPTLTEAVSGMRVRFVESVR